MCLDSALDLRPPGHFALGFFASRIGRSEMESSALGFGLEACFFIFFFFLFTKYFLPLLIFFFVRKERPRVNFVKCAM